MKKWASISLGERLGIAGDYASTAGHHLDELADRGINQETVDEMNRLIKLVDKQRHERDSLQSEVIAKTKEMNENLAKLHDHYSVTKQMVKLEIKQSLWASYGIHDKK